MHRCAFDLEVIIAAHYLFLVIRRSLETMLSPTLQEELLRMLLGVPL